jgi:LysM repeat protein
MLMKKDIKLSHMLLKSFICSLLIALLLASCSPTTKHRGNSYTVAQGDTLFSIATRHGTTVSDLTQTNRLSSSII